MAAVSDSQLVSSTAPHGVNYGQGKRKYKGGVASKNRLSQKSSKKCFMNENRRQLPVRACRAPAQKILSIPFHSKLKHVIAFVDVWNEKENRSADVHALLEAMGATIKHQLNYMVTHCVFHEGNHENLTTAYENGCSVVSMEWLDAVKHDALVPSEIPYSTLSKPLSHQKISEICEISDESIEGINNKTQYEVMGIALKVKSQSTLTAITDVKSTMYTKEMMKHHPDDPTTMVMDAENGLLDISAVCGVPIRNTTVKHINIVYKSHHIPFHTFVGEDSYTATLLRNNTKESSMLQYGLPTNVTVDAEYAKISRYTTITPSIPDDMPKIVVATYNSVIFSDLIKVIKKLPHFILTSDVCSSTTHVIAESETYVTYDVLKGIARGCYILKYNWVADSYKEGKLLPERGYEVTDLCSSIPMNGLQPDKFKNKGRKKLFEYWKPFYLANSTMHNLQLRQLIELCGGKVSDNIHKCCMVIGFSTFTKLTCVNKLWIVACILTNSWLHLTDYVLDF